MNIGLRGFAGLRLALLPIAGAAAAADPELVNAVRRSDRDAVRALLQRRADVNTSQSDGATALHWATHANELATARSAVIRAGANVNATNNYGVAPPSLARLNRSAAMVARLLTAGASAKTANTRTGQTALMQCARTGTADAVKSLPCGRSGRKRDGNARRPDGPHVGSRGKTSRRRVRVLIEHGAKRSCTLDRRFYAAALRCTAGRHRIRPPAAGRSGSGRQ